MFILSKYGLRILCINQGASYDRSTGQLEDYIAYLASRRYTRITNALQLLEKELNTRFDSKQLAMLYTAVIAGKHSLERFIAKLLSDIDKESLQEFTSSELSDLLNILKNIVGVVR